MKSRVKEQGSSVQIIIIIVLVIGLIGTLGFVFWQNVVQKDQLADTVQTSKETKKTEKQQSVDGVDEVSGNGTITGSLTYPSEVIPKDLVVYAQNLDTNKEYSTNEHLQGKEYTYGTGFELSVPAGRYYVYGVLSSDPSRKAYYNQVIKCGVSVDCKDTTKIEVVVKADAKTSDVTVGDWWSN